MKDKMIQEDFLFCKPLTSTTREDDVKKLLDNFFRGNNLAWNMISAVCLDEALAMLGRHSGFEALVKSNVPQIFITQCVLHRHSLPTKTLPLKVGQVLKVVVECVNYLRNSAMKHRIFKELCEEMYLGIRGTSVELKQVIVMHLEDLTKSLEGYFPTTGFYPAWLRHPFTFSFTTANVNDEYIDEIIELQQSQLQRQLFRTTTLSTFWCRANRTIPSYCNENPEYTHVVCNKIFFFDKSFSRMVNIKT
nr:protein ZBED8-like [Lepeophtheirus salmonis]